MGGNHVYYQIEDGTAVTYPEHALLRLARKC